LKEIQNWEIETESRNRTLTFSLGLGLEKMRRVPEKSRVKSGLVDGSEAIHTARSGA